MQSLKQRFPVYSRLVNLYPAAYRKEYGSQILQTTADMLDGAGSNKQKIVIWTKVIVDLPINITTQQLQLAGGTYMKDTPSYIKFSGIIAGILLIPFFAAIIANGLDKIINNHTLYSSWVWSYTYLRLWVLVLPTIAVLIALGALLYYTIKGTGAKPKEPYRRLFDIKHNWPIVLTGILALGIVFFLRFHDSAACWLQIPNHYLSHHNQSLTCQNYHFISNGPAPTPPAH